MNLPALVDGGEGAVTPPTPDLFALSAADIDFDRAAPEPAEWPRFLATLWPEDVESRGTLPEWVGYLLTPDTSQQKILLIVGPPRSGKGTIGRVLTGLLGVGPAVPVVTGDQVGHAKPDPDLFLAAAERLGVPVGDSVVVGDSVWDLLAAACSRAATGRMNWNGLGRTGSIRIRPTCCGTWTKSGSGPRNNRPRWRPGWPLAP